MSCPALVSIHPPTKDCVQPCICCKNMTVSSLHLAAQLCVPRTPTTNWNLDLQSNGTTSLGAVYVMSFLSSVHIPGGTPEFQKMWSGKCSF